jgi:hypothetical protein
MTLTPWQRTTILGALNYLKEIGRASKEPRAETLAQGLAEVLEPSRRAIRLQREAAQAASAGAGTGRERRTQSDRRRSTDRRQKQASFSGPDRRRSSDRRAGDRRNSFY